MKRHTNKQKKLLSVVVLGLVALGLAGVGKVRAAETKTSNVDVKFTVNSTMNVTIDKETMTVSELMPGTSGESDVATVTVKSNAVGGYYLSATAGTHETDTSLKQDAAGVEKSIESIDTKADLENLSGQTGNKWGFRFTTGDEAGLTSMHYNGLPQDGNDGGKTGTQLVNVTSPTPDQKVKCQVGVKVDSDLPAGTYKNVVNFYVVANN